MNPPPQSPFVKKGGWKEGGMERGGGKGMEKKRGKKKGQFKSNNGHKVYVRESSGA